MNQKMETQAAATQTLNQPMANLEVSLHEGDDLESNAEGGEGRDRGRGAGPLAERGHNNGRSAKQ